jgi:hypothetical protein
VAKIIDEEYWDNLKEPTKLMTFLNKFLTTPQASTMLIAMGVGIAAFFWAYFLVTIPAEDFLNDFSVYGQFSFELGWNAQVVDVILANWGSAGRASVFSATIANFVIMASYIVIFIGLIILATRQLKEKPKMQNIYLKMLFLPILAGIFNVIGNILMIIMLSSGTSVSPIIPFITSLCSIIKYALIISSFVVFLSEIVLYVIIYIKKHR